MTLCTSLEKRKRLDKGIEYQRKFYSEVLFFSLNLIEDK